MKKFNNRRGEGYVGSGIKILIAVVLGALLLSGLYALFNATVMPTVQDRVESLLEYDGDSVGMTGSNIPAPFLYDVPASCCDADHDGVFVVANIDIADYVRCTIDGYPLPSSAIRVSELGVPRLIRVDMNDDYRQMLSAGNHVFRVETADGYAEVILTKS